MPAMTAKTERPSGPARLSVEDALRHLVEIQRQTFSVLVERRSDLRAGEPTRMQTQLLRLVHDGGPLSVSELAKLLTVSVPTASQWVNRMADRGWLELAISDRDRRRHDIRITEAGAAILTRRYLTRLAVMRQVLDGFTPEERATLVRLIERAVELWHDLSPEEGSSDDHD